MAKQTIRQTSKARRFRRDMSKSQLALWHVLRDRKVGFRFKRERPVGNYVLDFYCSDLQFCVEVDGEQHGMTQKSDKRRDAFLQDRGIVTMRVLSIDCFEDADSMGKAIRLKCEEIAESRG